MKRAVGYYRLSNTKGDDISTQHQYDRAHAFFAALTGYVHDCARDDFMEPKGMRSGADDSKRPEWRRLKSELDASAEIGLLWSFDLSRISRGDDLMTMLLRLEKRGVEVVTERDEVDLKTLSGRTSTRFKGILNTWFREDISDRLKRKAQSYHHVGGGWWGRAPFGTKSEGHAASRRLIVSDKTYACNGKTRKEIDTIIAFFKLYCEPQRRGLDAIARAMNDKNYRGVKGRLLTASSLVSFLRSAKSGTYNGVIDADLLRRFLRRVKENSGYANTGGRIRGTPPLLWRTLICPDCGHRWSYARHSRRNHVAYTHYRADCPAGNTEVTVKRLDAEAIDIIRRSVPLTETDRREIAERAALESRSAGDDTARRAELEAKLKRLESGALQDLLASGQMSKEVYLKAREEIERELELVRHAPPRQIVTVAAALQTLSDMGTLIERAEKIDGWLANRAVRDFGVFYVRGGHIVDYDVVDELKLLTRKVKPRGEGL